MQSDLWCYAWITATRKDSRVSGCFRKIVETWHAASLQLLDNNSEIQSFKIKKGLPKFQAIPFITFDYDE